MFLAQQIATLLLPLNPTMVNAITGERMSSAQFIFTERPTITQGRTVSDRVYVGEIPNGFAPGNYSAAPLVSL